MKKLILALFVVLTIQSCEQTSEEKKINRDYIKKTYDFMINDTLTLNDGHIYYRLRTDGYFSPIHSQYCKNH